MPLCQSNRNQGAEELLDLRLNGSQIILHSRPYSRPPSRTAIRLRPMSATPTPTFLKEKNRKTPPWMRPQSADFSRNSCRKKIAAKFHFPTAEKEKRLKGTQRLGETYTVGSVSNLLGSVDDLVGSESSTGSSPIPSDIGPLCSKLEPGLISKPPIPPTSSNKLDQKSLDDIINIKFQRWFPESIPAPTTTFPSTYQTEQKVINTDIRNYNTDEKNRTELPSGGESNMSLIKKDSADLEFKSKSETDTGDTSQHFMTKKSEMKELEEFNNINDLSESVVVSNVKQNGNGKTTVRNNYPNIDDEIDKSQVFQNGQKVTLIGVANNVAPKIGRTSKGINDNETDVLADLSSPDPNAWKTFNSPSKNGHMKSNKTIKKDDLKIDDKKVKKVTIVESACNMKSPKTDYKKKNISKGMSEISDRIYSKSKLPGLEHSVIAGSLLQDENSSRNIRYLDPELISTINMDGNIRKNSNDESINRSNQLKEINEFSLNDDVISWVESHSSVNKERKDLGHGSTYSDIITMLEVLEKEEIESVKLEDQLTCRSTSTSITTSGTPVGASDILTYLDGLDKSNGDTNEQVKAQLPTEPTKPNSGIANGRMATLLNSDSSELAKHVMTLSLELEQRNLAYEKLKQQFQEIKEKTDKQKKESDIIIKRHQKFIDQLLSEKKVLGEQCALAIKEMSTKHAKTTQMLEERHSIELKKQHDKMLAAEKIRREKWIDTKTKKIKELTVKGLEPELQRMTNIHQEELSELRRAHDRELSEMELACQRRLASAREQSLRDRETAVAEERDAARKKVELEMSELERSYQDQRRKLLGEIRIERERAEKEVEITLVGKERHLEEKWQKANKELDMKLTSMEEKHQTELKNIREILEGERQSWLNHQVAALAEKEKVIREQCKKERDKHISMVLNKLDVEATEKERANEKKYTKLKEHYERELNEMEAVQDDLRKKLKDARSVNQQNEDSINQFKTQISQLQGELSTLKQANNRLLKEQDEVKKIAQNEAVSQISLLQRELREAKSKQEEHFCILQGEKQRELQQVYNRVIEAVSKKEEIINNLQKQRDAALDQCTQLEQLLEKQRKDFVHLK